MKYRMKLFLQAFVFVFMYGLQLIILTMSKVPQEAFGYTEVIHQTTLLDPKTFLMVFLINLVLFSLFLKISEK